MIHWLADSNGPPVCVGVGALQETRSICSAGRASWQRGTVGWRCAPALVDTDIFNRSGTSHKPATRFFSNPAPESRHPSSAGPEIRQGLVHTAPCLLSTSHYGGGGTETHMLEHNQTAVEALSITAVHNKPSLVN